MIYFLDFDRTLFDTDSFQKELPSLPGLEPYADELRAVVENNRADTFSMDRGQQDVWKKIYAAIAEGTVVFPPNALAKFLYKDTAEFLRQMGNEAIIITFGNPDWQKAKVESALAGVVRVTALYTGFSVKADYLKSWPGYYGQEAVYADDRVHELEAMVAAFPNIRAHEMRRDNEAGDGRWPVVRSLSELP